MINFLLFFSLFFPRISLIIAYIFGGIPVNNVPFIFDILGALIFPRILIIYYIWYAELSPIWMIAHVTALIIRIVINGNDD